MKPTTPIHRLRRRAKLLSREQGLPLHAAFDRIAAGEGFRNWGHLIASATGDAKPAAMAIATQVLARLAPGDLVLVGARPGEGKTLLSVALLGEAMKAGHRGAFFTLEFGEQDVARIMTRIGIKAADDELAFHLDCSDTINAERIAQSLATAPRGTLAVVDYLQLLDHRRENPPLMEQVRTLRNFARQSGVIIVFISQIDRSYDPSAKPFPDMDDVRLPNPLDLTLFDKMCFLNSGEVRFRQAA
ncbi:MAG: DNA helicase [Nitratireductor sp.]|nr:DNA helicase [Nitratireductor sp.]